MLSTAVLAHQKLEYVLSNTNIFRLNADSADASRLIENLTSRSAEAGSEYLEGLGMLLKARKDASQGDSFLLLIFLNS